MANLIEFAAITGTLIGSVLISLLIEWLSLEAFFRAVARVPHVAAPRPRKETSQGMKEVIHRG